MVRPVVSAGGQVGRCSIPWVDCSGSVNQGSDPRPVSRIQTVYPIKRLQPAFTHPLAAERPEVQAASTRLADAYQLEVGGAEASRMVSSELGGFVKIEATARGIQAGLRSSAWSPGASACW